MFATYLLPLGGGTLIGLAPSMMLLYNGRIAEVSGILSGLFARRPQDGYWRVCSILGLLVGGGLFFVTTSSASRLEAPIPMVMIDVAGFLVGYGCRLGNGCTSGQGVCGMG